MNSVTTAIVLVVLPIVLALLVRTLFPRWGMVGAAAVGVLGNIVGLWLLVDVSPYLQWWVWAIIGAIIGLATEWYWQRRSRTATS